ncbi:MAG: hypothetical protein QXT33_01665 [Thermofilum sp.]|uniref:Uncharacterized protein n=1 Tax=Thermofilum pendens TaxID=2269 RepID=A0A7C4D1E0_THEPE
MERREEHAKRRRKLILLIVIGLAAFLVGALVLLYSSYYTSLRFKASVTLVYPENFSSRVELRGASSEKVYYTVGARGGPFNITLVFEDVNGSAIGLTQLERVSGNRTGFLRLDGIPAAFVATAQCPSCRGEVNLSVVYASFDRGVYTAIVVLGSILAMSGAIALGLGSWLIVYEERSVSLSGATQLPGEHSSSDDEGVPDGSEGRSVT